MGLTYRGVNYDVGTDYDPGSMSREELLEEQIRGEVRAIRDELHCDSIAIYGTDLDRLVASATIALEDGLRVWIQPRLVQSSGADFFERLAQAAAAAEVLRRRYSAVTFNVGCELSLFAPGVIPGVDYQQRAARLGTVLGRWLLPWYNRKLNKLLARAAKVARKSFDGPLTYGSGTWERVDWALFDIVGLNYYRTPFNASGYAAGLRRFQEEGKPVVITEFGCASFEGAEKKGPVGHEIVDFTGPLPVVRGSPTRNEQVQADQLIELLDIFEASGVEGAFVYELIEPAYPYSLDPRHDLDMAGYGILKVIEDGRGGYRWEPKTAFHAIAARYRR